MWCEEGMEYMEMEFESRSRLSFTVIPRLELIYPDDDFCPT